MNSIRARLSYSFQGQDHELERVIDLDTLEPQDDEPPDFHRMLAVAAGIDTYSYLYEVVESSDIEFSDATGLAASCTSEHGFDWRRFRRLRQEDGERRVLAPIAARFLGVTDLDQRPEVLAALQAAYRAGKDSGAP